MTQSNQGRVLVVGMGISGLATATRLHRAGWSPVIIERAPGRRSGGYFVALFGAGQAAARRLGILDHVHDRTSPLPGLSIDRRGGSRPGMTYADLPGRPWLMVRGDVEEAAYATLPTEVETRFSTVPTAITQDADGVDVTLRNTATGTTTTERFELVVGADGLRSTVRSLAFGPHEQYLKRMGYMLAAFEYPGVPAGLTAGQGASLLEPNRSMWVFAFRDHNPTILLSYRTDDVDAEFTRPAAASVRRAFGPQPLGNTLDSALDAMDSTDSVLFDSVEQVRMSTWHNGRVVLVGDSAWCVTLYAGMGVSAALAGADVLGTMLERHPGDLRTALAEWERGLRPYVTHYQDAAPDDRKIFVADTPVEIQLRRVVPLLRGSRLGRRLADRIMRVDEIIKYKGADIVGEILGEPIGAQEETRIA
ncbi:FAD-dependent monooxygenase [Lentzea kentuckyensis]|uniref:FAD-dependent monooxygenase n=1 Tax=Lentzea kentuckyensis TaxID=360086 RepID=UPI000A37B8BB|nr:FAD-dependent monooxygenase [Lentzea kentuckyensis]